MPKEITVVIVSYYTGSALLDALRSVLSEPLSLRLVLVDNGNPPDIRRGIQALAEKDNRLLHLDGQGNIGFAAGCNLGALYADTPYILLLNPDCTLIPGTLQRLLDITKEQAGAWCMGAQLINTDGTPQRGSRRELLTPWLAIVEKLRLYRLAPQHPYFCRFNQHENLLPPGLHVVPATSGAFLFMPALTYRNLGGMDEAYFLHVEDLDFFLRLTQAGGRVLFAADIQVPHIGGSSDMPRARIEWYKCKSFIHYFKKHFKPFYPKPFLFFVNVCVRLHFLWRLILNLPSMTRLMVKKIWA